MDIGKRRGSLSKDQQNEDGQASSRKGLTAAESQNRFRWLRLGLLNVVFLVAPFGAWYFMHVQDRLETNSIRSFRALSEIDASLSDNLKNLPKIWQFSDVVDRFKQIEILENELASIREQMSAGIEKAEQTDVQDTQQQVDAIADRIQGEIDQIELATDLFEKLDQRAEESSKAVAELLNILEREIFVGVPKGCRSAIGKLKKWAGKPKKSSLIRLGKDYTRLKAELREPTGDPGQLTGPGGLHAQVRENAVTLYEGIPNISICYTDLKQAGWKSKTRFNKQLNKAEAKSDLSTLRYVASLLEEIQTYLESVVAALVYNERAVSLNKTIAGLYDELEELSQAAPADSATSDTEAAQFRVLANREKKTNKKLVDLKLSLGSSTRAHSVSTNGKDIRPGQQYTNAVRRNPALRNFRAESISQLDTRACLESEGNRISVNITKSRQSYVAEAVCALAAGTADSTAGSNGADHEPAEQTVDPAEGQQDKGKQENQAERANSVSLVRVPVDDLLGSITSGVSTRFDHVMLASEKGQVISLASTRVPHDSKQVGAISSDPFRHDFFFYSNLGSILANSRACQLNQDVLETEKVKSDPIKPSHAFTCQVQVGKTGFELFVQPSVLKVRLEHDDLDWFLIGVSRSSKLNKEAFVAPLSVSGPLLVLIIIALAALPLFWLATKSRKSLLTTTHCVLAISGGIVILSLSSMLAVHILFVRDYGLQQDVSLQELNRWISASFREELDTRIIGLEEDWKNSRDCKLASDWDPPGFPPYEVKFVLGKKIEDGGFPRNRGISLSEPQHKLHYTPTSVWVESRQYYRVPAGGESWEKRIQRDGTDVPYSDGGPYHPFFIERIRSFVDGVKESVVSIPVRESSPRCGDDVEAEVVVQILPFHSLTNVAMPPLHGFAVVEDRSGKVLYHSSDYRSLDENFIDETDGNQQLISLLQSRTSDFIDLDYQGKTIRAYAAPLGDVPWTLVTFIDDEIIDTVLLEALITTTGLSICFVLILLIAYWMYARLIEGRKAHRSIDWLWPSQEMSAVYPAIFAGALLMSLMFITAAVTGLVNESALHQLFFLAPFATLMILRLQNPLRKKNAGQQEDSDHGLVYWLRVACLVALLALFVVFNWFDLSVYVFATLLISLPLIGSDLVRRLNEYLSEKRKSAESRSRQESGWDFFSHLNMLAPLAAVLLLTGPVSGVILYLASVEVFSESFARFADDQTLRALDLRELGSRTHFKRYSDEGAAPPDREPFTIYGTYGDASCTGTYLGAGPFLQKLDGGDVETRSDGTEGQASHPNDGAGKVEGKAMAGRQDPCQQERIKRGPFEESCDAPVGPKLMENWVFWFVSRVPAFSYESGAIRQASTYQAPVPSKKKEDNEKVLPATGNLNDEDRLRWCGSGENGEHRFIGVPWTEPSYYLDINASDFSFQYLSRRAVRPEFGIYTDGWIRLSVWFSVLLFVILMSIILYVIARTIHYHMFSANVPVFEPESIRISDLDQLDLKHRILVSPQPVSRVLKDKYPKARWLEPDNWSDFRFQSLDEDASVIINETESLLSVPEQRKMLYGFLRSGLKSGIRIIVLMRLDPRELLSHIDERTLREPEMLRLDQAEIMAWRSLLRKFDVALVKNVDDGVERKLTLAEREEEFFANWVVSNLEERNTLYNLALSDLFNPKNAGAIRHLIRRGLVSTDKPHQLLDSGFKSYILTNADLEPLSVWRKQGRDSLWSALWPTLIVMIGLLMFFVISAGQNTIKTALTLVASIVAALPVLMGVFGVVRSNSSSSGSS
jgi:hypothetical protein